MHEHYTNFFKPCGAFYSARAWEHSAKFACMWQISMHEHFLRTSSIYVVLSTATAWKHSAKLACMWHHCIHKSLNP